MGISVAADSEALSGPQPDARSWRPLRFLNIYRIALATLFLVAISVGTFTPPLGMSDLPLFYYTSLAYLIFGIASLLAAEHRLFPFQLQLFTQAIVDILAIVVLMHASGGIASGLGMLLIISVANAGMITVGRMAIFFASLATIAILLEQSYASLLAVGSPFNYPQAGILGFTLFATAGLAHILARRARESEELAARREVDLADMAQLTEFIIRQMQTGVAVVDADGKIRLLNRAATDLLRLERPVPHVALERLSPELAELVGQWHASRRNERELRLQGTEGNNLLARFADVGRRGDAGVLVFLEDAARTSHQAQQLKLASLGRLTASIAHEIRNPLGAISHAGQLLAESPVLEGPDRRMTDIILEQSDRVNRIIESVLHLGRRDASQVTEIDLLPFVEQFVGRFRNAHGVRPEVLMVEGPSAPLQIYFDPLHLEQILTNLCQNALQHSRQDSPQVQISLGRNRQGDAYLDVTDNGKGIEPEMRAHVFEPFFTGGRGGNGLGLYIAREFAECNRATLVHFTPPEGGAGFRLTFGQPDQQIQ